MRMVTTALGLGLAWMVVSAGATPPPQGRTVPAGTQLDVLLRTPLNSGTAKAEQRFEAASLQNLEVQGEVVLAAGATVRGFVSSVKPSSKLDRQGQLTLSFDEVQLGDRKSQFRASVEAVLDPKRAAELPRLAATPMVGASADQSALPLMSVIVRAGGTIVASGAPNVNLPIGVILRIRLDKPLEIPR